MIGIKGYWVVRIDIDGVQDIVQPDTLQSLILIDEAGGPLPTFALRFFVGKRTFAKKLKEGSQIQLWVGVEDTALEMFPLRVYKVGVGNESDQPIGQEFSCIGYYDAPDYLYVNRSKAYKDLTSDQVMSQIAGRYGFSFECNDSLSDTMTWRQSNVTDRKFLDMVQIHSWGGESKVFVPAFTYSEQKMRYMNIPKIMQEEPKWTFTNSVPKSDNEISFEMNPELYRQTGVANTVGGYSRDTQTWRMTGDIDRMKPTTQPTSVDKIDRLKDDFNRINNLYWDTGNVHKNYYVAEENNIQKLCLYSSMALIITASNQPYKKIKPLDLASIVFQKNYQRDERFEEYSGKYLVTKVIRSFDSIQCATKYVLYREGYNIPTDTDS